MRALATLLLFALLAGRGARCEDPAHAMVVAGNRLAADAGLQAIHAGGSAADAAVAVLMVLSVVEPQAAGIGGGAVLVHFDAATRRVTAWDGRETAPAAATPGHAGQADDSRTGGLAVGVPGALPMLEALHHDHGRLPWADLLAPAIRLADQGAPVSVALAQAIVAGQESLRLQKPALGMFFSPEGVPLPAGSSVTNPALAQALRAIAAAGANGMLRGPIAAEIAIAVRADARPGLLTTDDLAAYAPRQREAPCAPYQGQTICAAAPPAGGIVLLEMLGLLEHTDFASQAPGGVDAAALMIQAEQLAKADQARYLADPDFVAVPSAGLLADAYLAERARIFDPGRAIAPSAGDPAAATPGQASQTPPPEHGTSSVAIVDAQGNAVALTATLGGGFGSQIVVHGFLLNAAMTGFAADPVPGDAAPANQIQPGKRPAASLAPAFVLDGERRLVAVIGSTGGARIPAYTTQALAGLLAWHMEPGRALALLHVAADSGQAVLEDSASAAALATALAERGQAVEVAAMPSATTLIVVTPHGLAGAADARTEGAVAGD